MSTKTKVFLLIFIILLVDQVSKILVKTNMYMGESIPVLGNWFILHFIENNGMAFGFEFAGNWGKYALSIFRIIAVSGLTWYILHLIKLDAPIGFVLALGLITAGAAGNIFDSAFYGLIFNESTYMNPMVEGSGIATLFPEGGGYSSFLQGRVVDMFYFPVLHGHYPEWIPWKGGDTFLFFRPVFNVADSAITIGVGWVLLFQRKYLRTL
jgi:signal peptidase II